MAGAESWGLQGGSGGMAGQALYVWEGEFVLYLAGRGVACVKVSSRKAMQLSLL